MQEIKKVESSKTWKYGFDIWFGPWKRSNYLMNSLRRAWSNDKTVHNWMWLFLDGPYSQFEGLRLVPGAISDGRIFEFWNCIAVTHLSGKTYMVCNIGIWWVDRVYGALWLVSFKNWIPFGDEEDDGMAGAWRCLLARYGLQMKLQEQVKKNIFWLARMYKYEKHVIPKVGKPI